MVDVVNDGVQAYNKFSEKHYDLLIADRKISRMYIKEVVLSFKKACDSPVVIMSDKAKEKFREDEKVGDTIIFMPFSEKDFLNAISGVSGVDIP